LGVWKTLYRKKVTRGPVGCQHEQKIVGRIAQWVRGGEKKKGFKRGVSGPVWRLDEKT